MGRGYRPPAILAGKDVGVTGGEHLRGDRGANRVGHVGVAGPEVGEIDRHAVFVSPQRFNGQVDVDRARQRVGDHQGRTRQKVLLDVGVDTALEVAVARQDRHHRQVVFVHGLRDAIEQRPGVADAGRAAVTGQVEAQLVERIDESRTLEVVHHDATARRERGLHPGLDGKPALDGPLGHQSGRDEHRGVGRVGTRRDGGHGDGSVT